MDERNAQLGARNPERKVLLNAAAMPPPARAAGLGLAPGAPPAEAFGPVLLERGVPRHAPRVVARQLADPTPQDAARFCLDALARQDALGYRLDPEPERRVRAGLQKLIAMPAVDDRVILFHPLWSNANLIAQGMRPELWELITSRYAREIANIARLSKGEASRFTLASLSSYDEQIYKAIAWLGLQRAAEGAAMSKGMVEVKDWIAGQQRNGNAIYSVYAG